MFNADYLNFDATFYVHQVFLFLPNFINYSLHVPDILNLQTLQILEQNNGCHRKIFEKALEQVTFSFTLFGRHIRRFISVVKLLLLGGE